MLSVTADQSGNVYAADLDHSIVVKIAPGGMLSVVAATASGAFPAMEVPRRRPR